MEQHEQYLIERCTPALRPRRSVLHFVRPQATAVRPRARNSGYDEANAKQGTRTVREGKGASQRGNQTSHQAGDC